MDNLDEFSVPKLIKKYPKFVEVKKDDGTTIQVNIENFISDYMSEMQPSIGDLAIKYSITKSYCYTLITQKLKLPKRPAHNMTIRRILISLPSPIKMSATKIADMFGCSYTTAWRAKKLSKVVEGVLKPKEGANRRRRSPVKE